jgi:glycosyltransferase involved in cell wall biosynthesis
MRVLVIAGNDSSLVNFRGALLCAIVNAGGVVTAVAPLENQTIPEKLTAMGVGFRPVSLARTGLNPLADAWTMVRLFLILRRERPDIVLSYTIKPVVFGSLVSYFFGVPRIYALITGLGAPFNTKGFKGRLLRVVATVMYRLACSRCTAVFVQNRDIEALFVREKILRAAKLVVVPGSGVDTAHFCEADQPRELVFLVLARMLWDKGIGEFVQAARVVKEHFPSARFVMVGGIDPNPAAISKNQLNAWMDEGVVEYHSAVLDVRPFLAQCSVFVLPSYHEGVPRSVLEAMAMGRPIITTDTIGCRETVFDADPAADLGEGIKQGINGFLVPVRGVESLAVAMEHLAKNKDLSCAMGRQSRLLAERYFDVNIVNEIMLKVMDIKANPSNLGSRAKSF